MNWQTTTLIGVAERVHDKAVRAGRESIDAECDGGVQLAACFLPLRRGWVEGLRTVKPAAGTTPSRSRLQTRTRPGMGCWRE